MVAHVLAAALESRARPVLVVTGHAAARTGAALGAISGVEIVHNPDFAEGMATSLKAGIAALPRTIDAALVLLGDMPLVSSRTLDRLIDAFARERPEAVVPVYEGRWGNPMLIDRSLFSSVMKLSGDRGARRLLEEPGRLVVGCGVDDPHVLTDVDTPEILASLVRSRGSDAG